MFLIISSKKLRAAFIQKTRFRLKSLEFSEKIKMPQIYHYAKACVHRRG